MVKFYLEAVAVIAVSRNGRKRSVAFGAENYGNEYGELYKPDSMKMGGGRGNGQGFDFGNFYRPESSPDMQNPPAMQRMTSSIATVVSSDLFSASFRFFSVSISRVLSASEGLVLALSKILA